MRGVGHPRCDLVLSEQSRQAQTGAGSGVARGRLVTVGGGQGFPKPWKPTGSATSPSVHPPSQGLGRGCGSLFCPRVGVLGLLLPCNCSVRGPLEDPTLPTWSLVSGSEGRARQGVGKPGDQAGLTLALEWGVGPVRSLVQGLHPDAGLAALVRTLGP